MFGTILSPRSRPSRPTRVARLPGVHIEGDAPDSPIFDARQGQPVDEAGPLAHRRGRGHDQRAPLRLKWRVEPADDPSWVGLRKESP
jgi:hypothetical protein